MQTEEQKNRVGLGIRVTIVTQLLACELCYTLTQVKVNCESDFHYTVYISESLSPHSVAAATCSTAVHLPTILNT